MKTLRQLWTWLSYPWACTACGRAWYFHRVSPRHPCPGPYCGHDNSDVRR